MAKKNPNDEPKTWVTALKLILGLVVIVGGVGLALWLAKDMDSDGPKKPSDAWGIANDSPVRPRR